MSVPSSKAHKLSLENRGAGQQFPSQLNLSYGCPRTVAGRRTMRRGDAGEAKHRRTAFACGACGADAANCIKPDEMR
jgi:hypothetical protein